MSFLSAIKKAFGFGADDEEFDDVPDDVATDAGGESGSEPQTDDAAQHASEPGPGAPQIDPAVKERIFDSVVAVFNEALPDFLRNSVDPEAQSRRLAQALDEGTARYLDSLVAEAQKYAEARLKSAADNAHAESERLRREMDNLEHQRTSLTEQKLSADRRHRALADRVNDLETQLAASEAEREQLDLEKRSLLNKLKVADVQPGIVEDMAAEIEQLKAQLEAEGNASEAGTVQSGSEETETLKARLEEALKAAEDARNDARVAGETAAAELEKARAEAEKATAEAADIRTQQEAVQGMYDDLQSRLGQEKEARQRAENQLAEARTIIDSMNELQEQMSKVEDIIRKRDQRIARLKAANKQFREQVEELELKLKSMLPHDDGLFGLPEENAGGKKEDKFSAEAMSALEEDFECPDWFVSEPAPGEVSPLLASDAEFGYQEPPRKPRKPENDAQLSLF